MLQSKIVIIYGNGGDLGDLSLFAQGIKKRLTHHQGVNEVVVKRLFLRDEVFDFITKFPHRFAARISEMHFICHAVGAGLFPGYHVAAIAEARVNIVKKAIKRSRRITYEEVLATETGAIFTDHLISGDFAAKASACRQALMPTATIKIWGCNSGVERWTYSDNGVVDQTVQRDDLAYYWRALNTKNSPKPSAAQAIANYFQRRTYGARSGAHVEVLHRGQWVNSDRYRAEVHQWPSPKLVHRLHPDKGEYHAFEPDVLP